MRRFVVQAIGDNRAADENSAVPVRGIQRPKQVNVKHGASVRRHDYIAVKPMRPLFFRRDLIHQKLGVATRSTEAGAK